MQEEALSSRLSCCSAQIASEEEVQGILEVSELCLTAFLVFEVDVMWVELRQCVIGVHRAQPLRAMVFMISMLNAKKSAKERFLLQILGQKKRNSASFCSKRAQFQI